MEIRKIRLEKKGAEIVLSPLESEILNVLWREKKSRVSRIHAKLRRNIALTSVAVSLDRLHKKRVVDRAVEAGRGGPHYIYYPIHSRHDFEKSIVDSTVNKLLNTFGGVALNYFDERFGKKKGGKK